MFVQNAMCCELFGTLASDNSIRDISLTGQAKEMRWDHCFFGGEALERYVYPEFRSFRCPLYWWFDVVCVSTFFSVASNLLWPPL